MSWAEIKKAVNSELNIPLNHLMWVEDLATYGRHGYVAKDRGMLLELVESIILNNHAIALEEWCKAVKSHSDYEDFVLFFANDSDFLSKIPVLGNVVAYLLKNKVFSSQILQNEQAVKKILETPQARHALINDASLISQVFNDPKFTNFLLETANLLEKITESYIAIRELSRSDIMLNAMYDKKTKFCRQTVNTSSVYSSKCILLEVNGFRYRPASKEYSEYFYALKNGKEVPSWESYQSKFAYFKEYPIVFDELYLKPDGWKYYTSSYMYVYKL